MTTQSLSRITLQTLENYRAAATQGVVAYRLGGHRLVGAVNGALQDRIYPRTARIVPRATERMDEVRGSVSKFVVKGIDQVARNTEKAIEAGSHTAAAQVSRLAKLAAGIDNEVVANGLQSAARLTMPGAKVALVLSSKVAEGAAALADAAGGRRVRKVVRTAASAGRRQAAPATRKAKTAVKAVARRAAKVARPAKAAKAPAPKVQRAARAAKKAVAEAAAA
jgi:hypothetical protein